MGLPFTADLVLVNMGTHRPVLHFYDPEGNKIAAESVVEVTEELEGHEDGSLTVQTDQTEMEPLRELTISIHGREAEHLYCSCKSLIRAPRVTVQVVAAKPADQHPKHNDRSNKPTW